MNASPFSYQSFTSPPQAARARWTRAISRSHGCIPASCSLARQSSRPGSDRVTDRLVETPAPEAAGVVHCYPVRQLLQTHQNGERRLVAVHLPEQLDDLGPYPPCRGDGLAIAEPAGGVALPVHRNG